jgi:hypothetical protein
LSPGFFYLPEGTMAAKKSPDAGQRFIVPCTRGLNTGETHPRIAAGLGPAPDPVAFSLQNAQAARCED